MLFQDALQHFYPLDPRNQEPLVQLPYAEEVEIKNQAFALFCKENHLGIKPKPLVESPKHRNYRTTSKRRVSINSSKVLFSPVESELEPEEHLECYRWILNKLNTPPFRYLAKSLNWVIIRGSYLYRAIIFNVDHLDANVVRKLKQIAKALQESSLKITAAHVYVDPSRSDYYLEANRPKDSLAFKQLYGPRELSLKLSDFSLRYPITGFSQINESQIPNLLKHAKRLLSPEKKDRLLDLYCGYGLFAFGIGKEAKEVIGAEWEGPSVESAKASAKYLKRFHYKFISGKIDEAFIERALPKPSENEIILLDPPRKGCLPGVIERLAKRAPKKVLHIFCGTDEIPLALKEWKNNGYFPKEILPLDLFPGTTHIETICLLSKLNTKQHIEINLDMD